jgi:hypothetical protein
MSEQKALPQNVRQWLLAVNSSVDYVIEKGGHGKECSQILF